MDSFLQANAVKWLERGISYHDEKDPHGCYFALILSLTIIARDFHNSSLQTGKEFDDRREIRSFLLSRKNEVARIFRSTSTAESIQWFIDRLSQDSDEQHHLLRIPERQPSSVRGNPVDKKGALRNLEEIWRNGCPQGKEREHAEGLVVFFWQIRNQLFHGEKSYGTRETQASDTKVLSHASTLLEQLIKGLLPHDALSVLDRNRF